MQVWRPLNITQFMMSINLNEISKLYFIFHEICMKYQYLRNLSIVVINMSMTEY